MIMKVESGPGVCFCRPCRGPGNAGVPVSPGFAVRHCFWNPVSVNNLDTNAFVVYC